MDQRPAIALSTHWNAWRHTDGESLIEEILRLGFDRVELGYDTRPDLVPGIKRSAACGAVRIGSVHNFCPVPMGGGRGHPELFTPADADRDMARLAVKHTRHTLQFAAELGAGAVVVHAGRVPMRPVTGNLIALYQQGRHLSSAFDRRLEKLRLRRAKAAAPAMERLARSLEELLPAAAACKVKLCLENMPYGEGVPEEREMQCLLQQFKSPWLRYWHDLGHGAVRQFLGLGPQQRTLQRLGAAAAGFHVHDARPPAEDHLAPGAGAIDFETLAPWMPPEALRVLEPSAKLSGDAVVAGARHVMAAWERAGSAPDKPADTG